MAGKPGIELSVEGTGLAALQRKLKAMEGGSLLARELNKELKAQGGKLIPDARAAARTGLPRAGGLAARIAGAPMRVQVSASKREPGVKIVVKGHDAAASDRGVIRHPVYGKGKWVTQQIESGWFSDTMKREGPKVRPHLLAAMERTAEKIARA